MAYEDGPRIQGRSRFTDKRRPDAPADQPDRLFGLSEMADLLDMHKQTLWVRLKANDGSVPPAFQTGGHGTRWHFSERDYHAWLLEQRTDDGH